MQMDSRVGGGGLSHVVVEWHCVMLMDIVGDNFEGIKNNGFGRDSGQIVGGNVVFPSNVLPTERTSQDLIKQLIDDQ